MGNPISNWFRRHRHPVNLALHAVGIPACFVAAPVLLVFGRYWVAAGVFVGGYGLQFAGHAVEGNESGEKMLLRRLTGRKAGGQASDDQEER